MTLYGRSRHTRLALLPSLVAYKHQLIDNHWPYKELCDQTPHFSKNDHQMDYTGGGIVVTLCHCINDRNAVAVRSQN